MRVVFVRYPYENSVRNPYGKYTESVRTCYGKRFVEEFSKIHKDSWSLTPGDSGQGYAWF